MVDQDEIRAIFRSVTDETLLAQVSGGMVARAGLHGVSADQLPAFVKGTADHIGRAIKRPPKLETARARCGACE